MSGSATTFFRKNPSFTEMILDEEYMTPINFRTHFFNISFAEQNPRQAKWEFLHDFLETYSLPDLSPDSIYENIAVRVRDEEPFAKMYMWNKVK